MATQDPGKVDLSASAAADLSTHQYKFLKLSGDDTVALVSGLTDNTFGILQNKPTAAGRIATVRRRGRSKVIAGATITAGAEVSSTAAGLAKVAVTTERIVGVCTKGGVLNDLIEIDFNPAGARFP